jgi:hypothetical protein
MLFIANLGTSYMFFLWSVGLFLMVIVNYYAYHQLPPPAPPRDVDDSTVQNRAVVDLSARQEQPGIHQ